MSVKVSAQEDLTITVSADAHTIAVIREALNGRKLMIQAASVGCGGVRELTKLALNGFVVPPTTTMTTTRPDCTRTVTVELP